MAKTFSAKIKELEQEKSKFDINFLKNQKEWYEEKMYEILENQWEQENAEEKLGQLRNYYSNIKETNQKIQDSSKVQTAIDEKINYYKEKAEEWKNIQLQRENEYAENWNTLTFEEDMVYQHAKEIWDKKVVNSLENRSLTAKKYMDIMKSIYTNLFSNISTDQPSVESTSKKNIELPKWMIEKIRKDLKEIKELKVNDIEKFLKKQLKKHNWSIRISHIESDFANNYDIALKYISNLIINYSEFSLVNNNEIDKKSSNKNRKSKHEKLKSTVSIEETGNNRFDRLKIEDLLSKAFAIKEINSLDVRISKYIDLFEELWYNFHKRKIFENELNEAITHHANHPIEKDIQKILVFTINGSDCFEKTGVYWYFTFKLNCWRRIIWYPNWEIFTICSHEEYDHIRDEIEPPKDKAI